MQLFTVRISRTSRVRTGRIGRRLAVRRTWTVGRQADRSQQGKRGETVDDTIPALSLCPYLHFYLSPHTNRLYIGYTATIPRVTFIERHAGFIHHQQVDALHLLVTLRSTLASRLF